MSDAQMYVYSTLATDVHYINYAREGNEMPIPQGAGVIIQGGAGVANDRFVTPQGVVTPVTAEEVQYLNQNPVFKLHQDNGFVKVDVALTDADKVATDMSVGDPSRQLTDADVQPESEDEDAPRVTTSDASPRSGSGGRNKKDK